MEDGDLHIRSRHRAASGKPGWLGAAVPDLEALCGVRTHARELLSSPFGRRLDYVQATLLPLLLGIICILYAY